MILTEFQFSHCLLIEHYWYVLQPKTPTLCVNLKHPPPGFAMTTDLSPGTLEFLAAEYDFDYLL